MNPVKFSDLKLMPSLLKAVEEEGYTAPSPIQEKAIPPVLEGRDLVGCAQTGTGKTAAFALPILQRLTKNPIRRIDGQPLRTPRPIRALILTPTRELALQIQESFDAYGRHTHLRSAGHLRRRLPGSPGGDPAKGRGHPSGHSRPPQ